MGFPQHSGLAYLNALGSERGENVSMATHAIPREEWPIFFDRFSLNHRGASATLEARGPELGDLEVASEQIFRGISTDQKAGENRIAIMMGALNDGTRTHTVIAPERLWLNDAQ